MKQRRVPRVNLSRKSKEIEIMKHVLFSFAAKRHSLRGFALATGLSILGLASHLNAQASGDLVANIPFTFQIGPTRMPAGTYVVHQNDDVLTVRQPGMSGRTVTLLTLPGSRAEANQTGLLEFNRYGDNYFLEAVWSPLRSAGSMLPKSSAERTMVSRMGSVQRTGIPLKTE
jgi:hypothetical protein